MIVAFVYAIIISLVIFPFTVGWTLGGGFLERLGLVDFSGCVAIHLVAGFASLFGAIVIQARLGRFEPLAIRKGEDKSDIYLSHM
jgi:Amt family ammonium transporter